MTIVSSIRRPVKSIDRRPFGLGILAPEPVVSVPAKVRERWSGPTDADQAWNTGFSLGYQGLPALAPSGWPVVIADRFYEGMEAGERQADTDREDAFLEDLARLATCNRPEGGAW